ncbi:hypothetical protein [Thiospirillum jenense]|uniref:Uncharacterized protein n=1 Tax=Thiospirillum jenense TaxID=1653858 RepID=A0A839HKV2_9GAMM|nr:hypothetical protein [Thiospirillum jenense]MBB1127197.1 hypothetical protein [Thiospirillum jenense]
MDNSSIRLRGTEIGELSLNDGVFRCVFTRALIIKTLTGSVEKTLWWQAGELMMENAQSVTALPSGQLMCRGGDIDDNIFTYRDMIPIPLVSRGQIRCVLHIDNHPQPIEVSAASVELVLKDVPKYICHLRPQDAEYY